MLAIPGLGPVVAAGWLAATAAGAAAGAATGGILGSLTGAGVSTEHAYVYAAFAGAVPWSRHAWTGPGFQSRKKSWASTGGLIQTSGVNSIANRDGKHSTNARSH
jgi:hypothetical protein